MFNKNNSSILNYCGNFLLILGILNLFWILFVIWFKLNYLQIDQAGHVASAISFSNGFFHQFQDSSFLGYIQNLFYPPLQDLIITFFLKIYFDNHVLAYKTYLSLLMIFYFSSIYLINLNIKDQASRCFLLICFLYLFNVNKPNLVHYQGLSFIDIYVTGLSTQFLAFIFFLLLIRELRSKPRVINLVILLSLTILSHIVVSLISFLFLFFYFIVERNKKIIFVIFFAISISSFYLIPFIAYRDYLVAAKIYSHQEPYYFFILAFLCLCISFKSKKSLPYLLTAFSLFLPLTIGPFLESQKYSLPNFHYYRFAMPALILLFIGLSIRISELKVNNFYQNNIKKIIIVLGFLGLLNYFKLDTFNLNSYKLKSTELNFQNLKFDDNKLYSRYWSIEPIRPIDFGLDSILYANNNSYKSNKGLYWESSRNNIWLSSYLATLLNPPTILNYFYYYNYSCKVQECLMESFFSDYNLSRIIINNPFQYNFLDEHKNKCYQEIFKKGETENYTLTKYDQFMANGEKYQTFNISNKNYNLKTKNNLIIEILNPLYIKPIDRNDPAFFNKLFTDTFIACEKNLQNNLIYINETEVSKIKTLIKKHKVQINNFENLVDFEFTKIDNGLFRINLPVNSKVVFKIKLNFFPGFQLEDNKGNLLPIFDSFPHILGIGSGTMYLRYKKTTPMYLGYALSILSLAVLIIFRKILN